MQVRSLDWEDSPGGGHGNPLQYSCLENPMNRGAWRATVHGVTKSRTGLKWLSMHALQGPSSQMPTKDQAGLSKARSKDRLTMLWITLFCTGLNIPIKRQRLSDWIKEQDSTTCCLQKMNFKYKDTDRLKINRRGKTYKYKEGHFVIIHQEDIAIINMYMPANRV